MTAQVFWPQFGNKARVSDEFLARASLYLTYAKIDKLLGSECQPLWPVRDPEPTESGGWQVFFESGWSEDQSNEAAYIISWDEDVGYALFDVKCQRLVLCRKSLKEFETQLHSTCCGMAEALYVKWDRLFNIVDANEEAARMFGWLPGRRMLVDKFSYEGGDSRCFIEGPVELAGQTMEVLRLIDFSAIKQGVHSDVIHMITLQGERVAALWSIRPWGLYDSQSSLGGHWAVGFALSETRMPNVFRQQIKYYENWQTMFTTGDVIKLGV